MKQKYTFLLKTNNSKIVLTDDSETFDSIQEKLSKLLNSKKIMIFQTNSDLIFIDPSQISAIHISKIEDSVIKEPAPQQKTKIQQPKYEQPSIIYDDEDDVDYNDEDDINTELMSQIDDSSTLFSELAEENSLYEGQDENEDDSEDSEEIFETEQILEDTSENKEI